MAHLDQLSQLASIDLWRGYLGEQFRQRGFRISQHSRDHTFPSRTYEEDELASEVGASVQYKVAILQYSFTEVAVGLGRQASWTGLVQYRP